MRTITVSTDVFAAIWQQRRNEEKDEDEILRRLFDCAPAAKETSGEQRAGTVEGVYDRRNGVRFRQGFKAFRRYKGQQFSAVAEDGMWRRVDTGERFPSLNQVNRSIVVGVENVWNGNWKYRADDNTERSIADLRRQLRLGNV